MLFGRHNRPNDIVPTSLVDAFDSAPAIAVFYDGAEATAHSVAINGNDIELTHDGNLISITYATRSVRQVIEKINATNNPWYALALNEVNSIESGTLTASPTDLTAEGGFVIRMAGHVVDYQESTRIRLLPPHDESRDLPWYPRIDTGSFSKTVNGITYLFSIPEYHKQKWSRFYEKPYMDAEGEVVERIGSDRLRVAKKPILWSGKNVTLQLNGKDLDPNLVKDVDSYNGIIYLTQDLSANGRVSATYTYLENSYVYKGVNLNPGLEHNPLIAGQFSLFYIVPTSSSDGSVSNETVVKHITKPTLQGCITSLPQYTPPIILLGGMQVRQTATIKDINISDTRTRGGGVKEKEWTKVYETTPGVRGNADAGWVDGEPYSGNAVLIIDIPNSIKTALGVEEIQRRATKSVAAGVKTLFDYRD